MESTSQMSTIHKFKCMGLLLHHNIIISYLSESRLGSNKAFKLSLFDFFIRLLGFQVQKGIGGGGGN